NRQLLAVDLPSVPGRNLVAPPKLTRNAPGLDIVHPVEIGCFPLFRHELRMARTDRASSRSRELSGIDVPLVCQKRLNHDTGSIAMRDDMRLRLHLGKKAERLHARDNLFARHEPVDAMKLHRLGQFGRIFWQSLKEGLVVLEIETGLPIKH